MLRPVLKRLTFFAPLGPDPSGETTCGWSPRFGARWLEMATGQSTTCLISISIMYAEYIMCINDYKCVYVLYCILLYWIGLDWIDGWMDVCMYVCMCVCVYTYTYTYTYTTYIHIYMYNMIVSHIRIEYIQFVHVWARAHTTSIGCWTFNLQPKAWQHIIHVKWPCFNMGINSRYVCIYIYTFDSICTCTHTCVYMYVCNVMSCNVNVNVNVDVDVNVL